MKLHRQILSELKAGPITDVQLWSKTGGHELGGHGSKCVIACLELQQLGLIEEVCSEPTGVPKWQLTPRGKVLRTANLVVIDGEYQVVEEPTVFQCGAVLAFTSDEIIICTERKGHDAGQCWNARLATLDWTKADLAEGVSIANFGESA